MSLAHNINVNVRKEPAFPRIFARVETIQCECGWERLFILPEEHELRLLSIFRHLEAHGITLPVFTVTVS